MLTSGTFATSDSAVRYDDSEPPFLVVTLPPHDLDEAGFRANLRQMDLFAERGGRFGFVLDTRGSPNPDADRRRAIADYWDDCLRRHGNAFIGAAIVMSSSTGRAVFKAILWLRSSSLLLLPVASPQEGLNELRAAAGLLPKRAAR